MQSKLDGMTVMRRTFSDQTFSTKYLDVTAGIV